jgi:hypothetical protein
MQAGIKQRHESKLPRSLAATMPGLILNLVAQKADIAFGTKGF